MTFAFFRRIRYLSQKKMQTKMKVVSLGRTAARVFAAAVLLLGAFSCAAPRYIALLPELQRDGATAIAFDAQVSRATLKTNAAFPDNGLSRRADRNIADALLDNGFFRTDTVRLLSTLPETLSGAVRMVYSGTVNAPRRKLHTVIVPERLLEDAPLSGSRFLMIVCPTGIFREREDKYDRNHSESSLSLILVDLQEGEVLYRGRNRMSIDPTWPDNARTQVRILLGDLFAGRITDLAY